MANIIYLKLTFQRMTDKSFLIKNNQACEYIGKDVGKDIRLNASYVLEI